MQATERKGGADLLAVAPEHRTAAAARSCKEGESILHLNRLVTRGAPGKERLVSCGGSKPPAPVLAAS